MRSWLVDKMAVLLVLGFFVVLVTAHNITNLEVPPYGDPREEARLECFYMNEKGDPSLHSVKWYRDSQEIFRFTPGQQPPTRTFNTSAGREVTSGHCTNRNCYIFVKLPYRYNMRLSYTCEVSTEGPRFAVVKQTKNLTVAVTLKEDPVIRGVPPSVQVGDDILVNCSTNYAMPPANLMWFIDGLPERIEPWMSDNTEVSGPDDNGLRSSWRPLRLRVTTAKSFVALRCVATQPVKPPYSRSKTVNLNVVRTPHLSMYLSGSTLTKSETLLVISLSLSVILSKYSALNV